MAHGIDVTEGQASFVSRSSAWHQLGVAVGAAFTAEDAMQLGHLGGWNVRKSPMFTKDENGNELLVPNKNAVLRDNPIVKGQVDVIGSNVSDNFQIIQNEEHAEFLNTLVDESGAHFETAGALNGGSRVFLTMKMPGHMLVGGVDMVESNIAVLNDHSGAMSFTMMITPVQVVCQNTLNLALKNNSNIFRIKHTQGASLAVSQARHALDLTFDYLDEFQAQADRLINTSLSSAQFEEIIRKEFGLEDDAPTAARTRVEKKILKIQELFDEAETVESKRNTAWGGLAALTEYADHFSETRGTDENGSRARKSLFVPEFKNRSLDLMLSLV